MQMLRCCKPDLRFDSNSVAVISLKKLLIQFACIKLRHLSESVPLRYHRVYPAKSHQRRRRISASRNDDLISRKVSGDIFKPIFSLSD